MHQSYISKVTSQSLLDIDRLRKVSLIGMNISIIAYNQINMVGKFGIVVSENKSAIKLKFFDGLKVKLLKKNLIIRTSINQKDYILNLELFLDLPRRVTNISKGRPYFVGV